MTETRGNLLGLSFSGTLNSYPFTSRICDGIKFSSITYSIKSSQSITFSLFKVHSTTNENPQLFYQEVLDADTLYTKRIPISSPYFYYTIDSLTSPDIVEVTFFGHQHAQFSASTFTNSIVPINENSNLTRNVNDFKMDLIRGLHNSFEKINIAGNIRASTEVTSGGGVIGFNNSAFDYLSTSQNLFYEGDSANDIASTGTGARTIKLEYNDTNNDRAELSLQTTGVTARTQITDGSGNPIPASCVERISVTNVGSTGSNAGNIIISNTTGDVFNVLFPTENISRAVLFRVPRNKSLVVSDISINGYSQISGVVNIILTTPATDAFNFNQIKKPIGRFRITTDANQYVYNLNANILAGEFISAEFVPDGTPTASTIDITLSMNAMLCPLVNSF
tara:strand:- start:4280 stop:5458 length:1179 start_codon:yes stop_codon:yes gene_type:complete